MNWTIACAFAVLALAAAGCASETADRSTCGEGAATVLADAAWDEAIVVEVAIRQDEFEPAVFGLLRDRPYVLRLVNKDNEHHEFEAPLFFRNVAVDAAAVGGQRLEDTCLHEIDLPAQTVAEIRLVPVRNGRYEFESGTFLDLLGPGYELGDGIGAIYVQ